MAEVGLVAMAYGTPAGPSDIEVYYTHIRRGRPPTAEQLEALELRYRAIGGTSPLAERTEAQRAGIAAALERDEPGRWEVVLGHKHAPPFIEDAVDALAGSGISEVVGLVLAPHYARASVGEYQRRLRAAAGAHGLGCSTIDSWHLEPAYLAFLTEAVGDALAEGPPRTKVLFTAHSLPEAVLVEDPYPDQLRASATAVAEAAGLPRWAGWSICWQSAGRTTDLWRGPDVLEVIDDLAATGRVEGVVVCPQGFVSDHLEVVYDLDIEARDRARQAGLAFTRTRVVNDDPHVLAALADRVRATAIA